MIHAFKHGATPEEIAQRYPAVTLADIYATITYYLQHGSEVDAYLNERDQEADVMRQANAQIGIRERLLARRD